MWTPELVIALTVAIFAGIGSTIAAVGALLVSLRNQAEIEKSSKVSEVKLEAIKEDAAVKDVKLEEMKKDNAATAGKINEVVVLVDGRTTKLLQEIALLWADKAKESGSLGDQQMADKAHRDAATEHPIVAAAETVKEAHEIKTKQDEAKKLITEGD